MSQLFVVVVALACPVSMLLMMRVAMHGGHGADRQVADAKRGSAAAVQDARIAELEREVERLRAGPSPEGTPDWTMSMHSASSRGT
jgi:hypothetical protein